jgi:hypothetical protein
MFSVGRMQPPWTYWAPALHEPSWACAVQLLSCRSPLLTGVSCKDCHTLACRVPCYAPALTLLPIAL